MPGMTSTVEMDGMKVTYTFNVPSTIGPDKIKASLEAHSDSKINEMLAMHIGTCAGYTVTVATSPVTSMGNTVDSAGNAVTVTAAPAGNQVTAGSEAATTTVDAHDGHDHDDHDGHDHDDATTTKAADSATSDARSESITVMAVMATAAVTLA